MARPEHRFDAGTNSCRNLTRGELEWDSRSWGVGGQVFRDICKSCHHRGSVSEAGFLWVESKTSQGWNRIFAKNKVVCAKDGSWSQMTSAQQRKLNDYLFRFGHGSADANDNA